MDLISRQAAIDAICEHGTDLERSGITVLSVVNHKQVTVDLLEKLPSEERKGKWINEPYEKGLYVHRCSNCLKASGIGGGDLWFNFCPNCGADMRGEEDEVD